MQMVKIQLVLRVDGQWTVLLVDEWGDPILTALVTRALISELILLMIIFMHYYLIKLYYVIMMNYLNTEWLPELAAWGVA